MKKKLLVVILAAIAILLLAGCGEKPASEATLKEDIYNSSNFSLFSEQLDMEITDLEVVKRQTTTEDKVDTVWVKVTAAGDTAEGEMYYKLTYHLYNDGWLLEAIADDTVDSWHFKPLEGVPDEVIASYIPEGAEILENTVDLEVASHTVTYTYEESHLYCDVTYKKQLVFNFGSGYYTSGMHDPGRWGLQNEVDVGSYEDWHLEGTWYLKSFDYHNDIYYYLKIETVPIVSLNAHEENGSFKISGTFERVVNSKKETFEGPFTVEWDEWLCEYQIETGYRTSVFYLVFLFSYDEPPHCTRGHNDGASLSLLT